MFVTKFGHCCLLIEEKELRILTDPGIFTTKQNEIGTLDIIIITHEHSDHLHVDSLKKVIGNNPKAKIITNGSVGKILKAEHIAYQIVDDEKKITVQNVVFEGFGVDHAEIYKTIPKVENTGYLIGERLFYPGDAFTNPNKTVEILALPIIAPWTKVSEVIDYALLIGPKKWFPVHDAISTHPEVYTRMIGGTMAVTNSVMISLPIGERVEI